MCRRCYPSSELFFSYKVRQGLVSIVVSSLGALLLAYHVFLSSLETVVGTLSFYFIVSFSLCRGGTPVIVVVLFGS